MNKNLNINSEIPKIIHYCWFGKNPLGELELKCLDSWKKFHPDFEIMRWDESNFDIKINKFVYQAYLSKKWAFVADFARVYALYLHGGIYCDTDMEIIKPLDPILSEKFNGKYLNGFMGFEDGNHIAVGIIGATKNNALIKMLVDSYDGKNFWGTPKTISNALMSTLKEDSSMAKHIYFIRSNVIMPHIATKTLQEKFSIEANQNIDQYISLNPNDDKHFAIFRKEYFYPMLHTDKFIREEEITSNTYTCHHYCGSWSNNSIITMIIQAIYEPKLAISSLLRRTKLFLFKSR